MPPKSRHSSRQIRSSRPSPPSVPLSQPPNGVSAPSHSTQTTRGYPCVYTKEYQEYYVKGMERLEKGKGREWSIKKREFQVMEEWEKEWSKQNGSESGGKQESISQDGGLSDFGAAFSKSNLDENSLNLSAQQNSIASLLLNPPSSSDSDSSSSDLDFVPDDPDPHPNHLPSSVTHAIHSEVRKIYESPKKATSFILDPQQGLVEVEVEIEEGGQRHMHWIEQEKERGDEQEKQRNLEEEIDEEENDDYLFQEDRQQKMGSLLERIGDKHESEEGEGEREEEEGEQGEIGEKSKENEEILEMSVTTVQGVVEMEEDEDSEEASEKSQELEGQLRQTLASSNVLDHIGDNYRCDCYDDEDQEMMQNVTGGGQYGMGIEGGLNSTSGEEEGNHDSDSLHHSISLQQPQPPAEQRSTTFQDASSNKLKNFKKKEQKKRKKDEKKRAKLAGELEKVKGEKRKAVDEVIPTQEGKSEKKVKKGKKAGGLNA